MANDGEILIGTKIDTSGAEKGVSKLTTSLNNFAKKAANNPITKIAASLNPAVQVASKVSEGFGKVTAAIKDVTDAYKVQATAETQLESAAKNNPYLLPESVRKLKDYAGELQSISTYGDEELLPLMAQLAAAGRTQAEIQDIMTASVNVAASGTMSLDSAVRNLNKTYSGLSGELGEAMPAVKNLTQEELKNGEAVKVIQKQYGGMAEEVAKATGTSQQLKNAMGDLKEELGAPFEKVMGPVRSFFTELVGGWASALKAQREYSEALKKLKNGTADVNSYDIAQILLNKEIQYTDEKIAMFKKILEQRGRGITTDSFANYSKEDIQGQIEQLEESLKTAREEQLSLIKERNRLAEEERKKAEAERQAEEAAANTKKKQEQGEAAANRQNELREEFKETLRQKELELKLRKENGETITDEAGKQEILNTALGAYYKMMTDTAMKGQNTSGVKTAFGGQNTGSAEGNIKGLASDVYGAEAQKQAAVDEKVDAVVTKEKSKFALLKEKELELRDLKKEIAASEIDDEEWKKERIKQIEDEIKQAQLERVQEVANQAKMYTDQTVQIMQDAASLMLQTQKWQSEAELNELEIKYRRGEMSEEEYNEAVTKAKQKAAKEQYKVQMFQWSASLLQATANIAAGVAACLSQGMPAAAITMGLTAAAGALQIASLFAAKPVPPSFSTGGIVGGRSYSGDNIAANLNSREMVMNMNQQKGLWDFINGGSSGNGNGVNIVINNSASNVVSAKPQITKDQIEILIDARVNESMQKGRYDNSLNMAQQGMGGDFYGI